MLTVAIGTAAIGTVVITITMISVLVISRRADDINEIQYKNYLESKNKGDKHESKERTK